MLSTLRNAWKVPELKKRILFTVLVIMLFRLGNFIPVPGVDTSKLVSLTSSDNLFSFYDMLSGGAFSKFSIFALTVGPYINASIIFSLLTVAIPALESIQKEGKEGRKKIQKYTKIAAIFFAVLQSAGTIAIISQFGALKDTSMFNMTMIVITLTTGSIFLYWLGDQITAYGIGNGVSLIIFVNIVSRIPQDFVSIFTNENVTIVEIVLFLSVMAVLLLGVIFVNMGERRIPVQYAGKAAGGKTFRAQSSHIPINVNGSAVIAIIFAMSVMMFPNTIAQFVPNSGFTKFIQESSFSLFRQNTWQYGILYFILIVFFCWFYTEITLKPDEMAENMHKSSGFIPGIRPGEPTRIFIERVIGRISILGGCYAGIVAVFPVIVTGYTSFNQISFSGTAILIAVGVSLETMKTLESQLVMRHYQGFLK